MCAILFCLIHTYFAVFLLNYFSNALICVFDIIYVSNCHSIMRWLQLSLYGLERHAQYHCNLNKTRKEMYYSKRTIVWGEICITWYISWQCSSSPVCIIFGFNKKRKKRQIGGGMYYVTTHIVSRRKLFLYKARMKNGP